MARSSDYITEVRNATRKFWDAYQTLKSHQMEWDALAYGDNLPDGLGENSGITKDEVGAVVFDTANAIEVVMNDGHKTNLAKLL